MPDWNAVVHDRLGGLSLSANERREVIAELATHLEETFEELRRQGLPEQAAIKRTLSQIGDWQDLRRKIQIARNKESTMTNRVKQFWLPGFATLFLSVMLLMFIQFFGPLPLFVSTHGWRMMAPVAVVYVPWLLLLLPVGAVGAYMAGRAGASQRVTLLTILFPVLPHAIFFLIGFPISVILADHIAHNIMLSAWFIGLFAWVGLPAVALLAGGLPVQMFVFRRQDPRRTAGL
jgi:hypothetical protein